jgi:histidine ammonia-lyase
MKKNSISTVVVGDADATLSQILAVASGRARVRLSTKRAFAARLEASQQALRRAIENDSPIYGVVTGFGNSCGNRVESNHTEKLGENLLHYHRCGVGPLLTREETRAAMFCRLLCLARGYSGVSRALLQRFVLFLNEDIVPLVPSRGSVGASGDLTPMAYIAAAFAGWHEVEFRGRRMSAKRALRAVGAKPYAFRLKEPLAVLNGTSIMTGIAAVVTARARGVLRALAAATALSVHAMAAHAYHFHETIFAAKPFAGQAAVAAELRRWLDAVLPVIESTEPPCLQDPYSLRCAPQVLGVLADALDWIENWVTTEANSVNDNPIFDPASKRVLMGGNFYGGHIAMAMDSLKAALASAADMSDRQIALLVDKRFNRGLNDNLVMVKTDEARAHHGFKGMQITASALTAEALKATMPAAVFSRSTECHNQDKVSMGTIAASDAWQVCELVERVAAIHLLAAAQAAEMRGGLAARPALRQLFNAIRRLVPANVRDRAMDVDLELITHWILSTGVFGVGGTPK